MLIMHHGKGKSKVHPVTCHEENKGKQRYSSTSLTSALDGGRYLTPQPGWFTLGNDHSV
jgi:hypothetical protein